MITVDSLTAMRLKMQAELDRPSLRLDIKGNQPMSLMGIEVQTSNAFPMIMDCNVCAGTGEGTESTYCPKCNGQGKTKAIGIMDGNRSQKLTILTERLPKAFQPHWPLDVPVPLRGIRRL